MPHCFYRIFCTLIGVSMTILTKAQDVMHIQSGGIITVQSGGIVAIAGNATAVNGSVWKNEGVVRITGHRATGTAAWVDQTQVAYAYGSGAYAFEAANSASIQSPNLFARIDIGGAVSLGSDISSLKWYLINGRIATHSYTAIASSASGNAIETAPLNPSFSQSWFDGQLRRSINAAANNTYVFPVGNSAFPAVVELDNLMADPINSTSITVSFVNKPGTDTGITVSEGMYQYTGVANTGVWNLVPDVVPNRGFYDSRFYITGFSGLTDNRFTLLVRPVGSTSASDWTYVAGSNLPGEGMAGRMVNSGYARRNHLHAFGQFGIAEISPVLRPLPVTLQHFSASRRTSSQVNLTWQTLMEQNNKGFIIERRLHNEVDFRVIGFVASQAAGGNGSSLIHYRHTDANAYARTSYYRLKQVDIDGKYIYSTIKAVQGTAQETERIWVGPNPNTGQFTIKSEGLNKVLDVQLADATGSVIQRLSLSETAPVNIAGLSSGTYYIIIPHAFSNGKAFQQKVVVVK